MKRSIIISVAVALALSACGGGDTVGTPICKKGQDPRKDNCIRLGERPPSPSPTKSNPKGSQTTAARPTPTKTKAQGPSCATYKGKTWTIVIKDQYEKYKPESLNLYRGDYILFKNEDPSFGHSLTVDGTNFDTGILKPGESKKLRVMLAPKLYKRWHDRNINYIDGGPLNVTANKRCP